MKKQFLIIFLFEFIVTTSLSFAQLIRPIRDNVGYCWQGERFDKFISWLDDNCTRENFKSENLIAGISPHDDYLYAGKVYYPLFKLIKAKEVVIFGVTHGTVRKEMNDPVNVLILDEFNKWRGPYGNVEISPLREKIKSDLDSKSIMISNKAHTIEHSIEGLIPFLQHYNKGVKITPIMVTKMSLGRMDSVSNSLSNIISDYIKFNKLELGKDIFFLISNDANHYGEDFNNQPYGLDEEAHQIATDNDMQIAAETFNGTIDFEKIKSFSEKIWPEAGINQSCPLWCGRYPIAFGLLSITKVLSKVTDAKLSGKVFSYSDTWTGGVLPVKGTKIGITAPYSLRHWVGFLSAGFYMADGN